MGRLRRVRRYDLKWPLLRVVHRFGREMLSVISGFRFARDVDLEARVSVALRSLEYFRYGVLKGHRELTCILIVVNQARYEDAQRRRRS